ncbi:ATP-binding cassette domain-containing protein [Pseudooceanicola sp. 216_PA32_1]|uniref:ATP-binding cassette domain-containing protein n=1 Tax=Pseudooceanicola pacificus TaxID=2676438 RepID=A0A844W6J2_9RHOB|nr:ABC transporter ATP-binding protein [Pseudooceanicola pacificus]MWB78364.1 ATP-binding cassette domain-containing protein [Pseudooceanicola pacificus]
MTQPFLSVRNLSVSFGANGEAKVVNGVSFDLEAGKTLCLVGESGSGKSVTATSLMGLHPAKTTRITADRMELDGIDLLSCDEARFAELRGTKMAMIFQDPMSSLNPALTIGFQLREAVFLHENLSRADQDARVLEVLQRVRIPDPERRMTSYPHELSGGMRQRVMIAMALICRPKLLIADEPTTALDVTVQAQILWLLGELQREFGTAIIFITHDLGVVAEIGDDVAVMYAGSLVEKGSVFDIFDRASHGYTAGLLSATAEFHPGQTASKRLVEIPGSLPQFSNLPQGCNFADRCAFAAPSCLDRTPDWREVAPGHVTSCDQPVGAFDAPKKETAR